MKIIIILPLFSFILSQECIMGKNCPYNQGTCVENSCKCLDGYRSFFDPKFTTNDQIYCNYKQKHHLIALVLELILPGFGHFYVGKYWFGLIKLILCFTAIATSFYLYKEMRIPGYVEAVGQAILNKITEKTDGPQGRDTAITIEDIAQILFNITFHPFWIFYLVDIFMYYSKSYNDGYDVPLF